MNRIKIVGVCLMATFAFSAVATATAFGASEFLASGGANPKGITTKGEGGKASFESESGNLVECEKSKSTGEFLTTKEAKVTVEYSGNCKLSGTISAKCPSITTKELKILPGSKVGTNATRLLVLLPKTGEVMAEFTCESTKVKVTGGVICLDKEPKLGTKTEVECKASSLGVQEFKEALVGEEVIKDELKAEATLGFFKISEKDAQTTTEKVTSSASVEQTEG